MNFETIIYISVVPRDISTFDVLEFTVFVEEKIVSEQRLLEGDCYEETRLSVPYTEGRNQKRDIH